MHKNNITSTLRNILLNYKNILLESINISPCFFILILCLFNVLFFNSFIDSTSTSALSSQNNTNIEFTLNPTLSLSLSGSLSLLGLQPGTSADSNVITIDIGTNNVTGYTLSANVGNSTNNTTSLTNTNDDNYTFTNLSSSIFSLSDFNDNEWGYSYSVDNGTNWLSGDITSPSNGYGGLPIYSSTNSPKLNETYSPSNDSIKFKIGAKAASNQVAGTYTNVVNFYAITNPAPVSISDAFAYYGKEQYQGYYKMQDMTTGICGLSEIGSKLQVIDVRDDEIYTIAKLKDDNCWMLDNLRLGGDTTITLTPSDTNIVEDFILPASGTVCFTASTCTNTTGAVGTGYTVPAINTRYKDVVREPKYGDGSNKVGAHYNYCAASAGAYCVDESSTNSHVPEYNICSKGWRMASGGPQGEYQNLYDIYDNDTETFRQALSAVLTGFFRNGSITSFDIYGYSWSSTYKSPGYVFSLYIGKSSIDVSGAGLRYDGGPVRCLAR